MQSSKNTEYPLKDTNNHAEFKGQIIDLLEDLFTKKKAVIPNADRDALIKAGDDEETLAIIYDADYDAIADDIQALISKHELDTKTPKITKEKFADKIMGIYNRTINKARFQKDQPFTDYERTTLREKLLDTLNKWNAGT